MQKHILNRDENGFECIPGRSFESCKDLCYTFVAELSQETHMLAEFTKLEQFDVSVGGLIAQVS